MSFWGRSLGKFIQHEDVTIPCTVKTMRQLLIDRIRLTARLASAPEYLYYNTYCMPSVQHNVPYAVAILV